MKILIALLMLGDMYQFGGMVRLQTKDGPPLYGAFEVHRLEYAFDVTVLLNWTVTLKMEFPLWAKIEEFEGEVPAFVDRQGRVMLSINGTTLTLTPASEDVRASFAQTVQYVEDAVSYQQGEKVTLDSYRFDNRTVRAMIDGNKIRLEAR